MRRLIRKTPILAVVLSLLAGAGLFLGGAASANHVFTDAPPWIHEHSAWLFENGIANGYPDGSFRPDDDITRGQSAFWLGNYNDAIQVEFEGYGYSTSTWEITTVDCPGDMRAVAGGGSAGLLDLAASNPTTDPVDGSGWSVAFRSFDGNPQSGTVSAYALCVPRQVGP